MDTTQTNTLPKKRSSLITFTCWAIWLIVIPIISISVAKMIGLPGFWNASGVNIELPLPVGLFGLLLFLLSTIGLWQMKSWGVLLYGFAGLLAAILMAAQPGGKSAPATVDLPNTLEWVLIGCVHLMYTITLWKRIFMS
jgi:hypothetical protein